MTSALRPYTIGPSRRTNTGLEYSVRFSMWHPVLWLWAFRAFLAWCWTRLRSKLGVAGLFLCALTLLGCPRPAQTAGELARDSARGAIAVVVEAVDLADVVCANIAARAKGSEDFEKLRSGIELAGKCARAKDAALAAARAARQAITAWGSASAGAVACAGAQALEALSLVRDAAARADEPFPDVLVDAISQAAFLARFVPNGGSCPLPKAVK